MKNLFLMIGIAFYLASYSLPLHAKEDKNTEITLINGNDTITYPKTQLDTTTETQIIINNDTIFCSKGIVDKYGPEKIIQAYENDSLVVDTIEKGFVLPYFIKKQDYIIVASLIKQEKRVVEVVSDMIYVGKKRFAWISIIIVVFVFWFITWFLGLQNTN